MRNEALIIPASSLGFTPGTSRKVTPVPAWAKTLVPKPDGKNETIKTGAEDVEADTMPLIKSKVYRTLWHTEKLAPRLKRESVTSTARADWNFIFNHIKYVKDKPGVEQVRSPRRLIHDGKGDCDCFTVTLSSLLINQGIPHFLRIIKQGGGNHWSHIYIVVPKNGNIKSKLTSRDQYIVMDCVMDRFDDEPPFTTKKDFPMALQSLDGIRGFSGGSLGACPPKDKPAERLRRFVPADEVLQKGFIPTEMFLKENKIAYTPALNPETNSGSFVVDTRAGLKNVPTVITKEQAIGLLDITKGALPTFTPSNPGLTVDPVPGADALLTTTAAQATTETLPQAKASAEITPPSWLLWAIAGGVLIMAASSKKKAAGLSGVQKTKPAQSASRKPVKRKASRKKLKTLSI